MSEQKDQVVENSEAESVVSFDSLGLKPEVLSAVKQLGYETPSSIQEKAIPHLLAGKDILGVAQTGTGKTAAFALPLLSTIDWSKAQTQVLVLAPTRELAIQVAEAFATYAKNIPGFRVLPIYGGQEYRTQLRQLERGPQVIVGTPGRVMDHIRKGTLNLSNLSALVLDEADEMLRMGFIDDVEWILQQMPKNHQTALFSATMPSAIRRISQSYLKDPMEVTIKLKTTTAETINQRYWQVRGFEKTDVLLRIMEVEDFDAMIIFVRTKNATVEVAEKLQASGYAAEALNGDIAQAQRERVINLLKGGRIDIIVATDVAARGLDVERISHVVNYDVPYDTESYVHRIGRTGRAGRSGDAILFITGRERNMLSSIEHATRQPIQKFKFPTAEELNQRKLDRYFASINLALEKDLTEYSSVIAKYIAKFPDVEVENIAAALASMHADGKAFYIQEKSMPVEDSARGGRESRGAREPRQRRDRDDRGSSRGDKKPRQRPDLPMDLYRLAVGESHGASKGDIVGAIANEAGINSQHMGKIRMHEGHSFIELPTDMPKDTLNKLGSVRVRGQQLQINLEKPSAGGAGKSDSYRDDKRRSSPPRSKEGRGAPKQRRNA